MAQTCPIWLVVGFLGAGKTTLLRRLADASHGRNLIFVVNEFSAVDVDARVLEREGAKTIAVSGGSIFCRCRVTEFVDVLRRVAEGRVGTAEPGFCPGGIVIEASGMADPRSMRRLLAESGLDARFHVAGVTAVVDPGTVLKLLSVLPNIRGQIESALSSVESKLKESDRTAIESSLKELERVSMELGKAVYEAQTKAGPTGDASGAKAGGQSAKGDDVIDAEYEVKDDHN